MMRIPTPFAVGDVNIYVLGDTLLDTGPRTPDALQVVEHIDLERIENVLVTHGHVDHHGLAYYVRQVCDCNVFVHENDFSAVSDYERELKRKSGMYAEFLRKSGISPEVISEFELYYKTFREYGQDCEVEVLPDEFETEKGVLEIIHTPGHTGGSCCFLLDSVLYSGDTLLPTISTNPSIHAVFDSMCGLKSYQKSLEKILEFDIRKVLPGHGDAISDCRTRIERIFKEHVERKEKVIASVSETPQNLVEVTEKVFQKVPFTETLLALAECYDHLKVLKEEKIVEIVEDDCYHFLLD